MRVVFCHIPKTAGTTVNKVFRAELAASEGGFVRLHKRDGYEPSEFKKRLIPPDWRYMHGHIPVRYFLEHAGLDHAAEDIVLMSFVRDPIDRLVSLYNYVCSNPLHLRHETVRQMDRRDFILENQGNEQSDFLAAAGVSPAWKVLISAVDDLMPSCSEVASELFHREVPPEAFGKRENMTTDFLRNVPDFRPMKRSDIPADLLGELKQRHSNDLALYRILKTCGPVRHFL